MADDPREEPSEEEFRDMLRDFLAGNTDMDPARLASAAGLPNDPELVQRLIGQLQQALQNSSDGITIGRLTSLATWNGLDPAMRAASSTSEPRLFSADDEYR